MVISFPVCLRSIFWIRTGSNPLKKIIELKKIGYIPLGAISRIFTVAFLLFLDPAGGSNPVGPIARIFNTAWIMEYHRTLCVSDRTLFWYCWLVTTNMKIMKIIIIIPGTCSSNQKSFFQHFSFKAVWVFTFDHK